MRRHALLRIFVPVADAMLPPKRDIRAETLDFSAPRSSARLLLTARGARDCA
jgi:hypothetical protein